MIKTQKNVFKTRPWTPAILTPRSIAMFLTIRKISALPRFFLKNLVLQKSFQTILDYSIFRFFGKSWPQDFQTLCFFEEFVPRNCFQFFLPRKISSKIESPYRDVWFSAVPQLVSQFWTPLLTTHFCCQSVAFVSFAQFRTIWPWMTSNLTVWPLSQISAPKSAIFQLGFNSE